MSRRGSARRPQADPVSVGHPAPRVIAAATARRAAHKSGDATCLVPGLTSYLGR